MPDTPTIPPITSDEDAAHLERELAAYRAQQEAERQAARAAKLKPITELLASDAWAEFRTGIQAAERELRDEPFWTHLNALNTISATLPGLVR